MAYRSRSGTGRRASSGSANINLNINTTDGDYLCESTKVYTEKSSIVQDLDTSIIKISTFDKNLGALTIQNAKAIVIKNLSDITAEIFITVHDFKNHSDDYDVVNSVDVGGGGSTPFRTMTMLLPANDFLYLPNNRLISYSQNAQATFESGANAAEGRLSAEPKDLNSGQEYIEVKAFSSTYFGGASILIDDGSNIAISATSITVDDGDWFKEGDLLFIENGEVVEVESIATNVLTCKRGMLGSNQAQINDNHKINFFFGNEYLAFDNGRCQTDSNGRFKQRGAFFGYGRTSDKIIDGIVPGSVAIGPFYTQGGYLDWGLTGIKASDKTGLAASTTYTFHIVVDEYNTGGIDSVSSETAIAFTTDASDTTFAGSGNAVLPKVQSVLDEKFYDASSGLFNKKVTIGLHNGDVRVASHSNHSSTIVGIGNVSGTTPFDVGRFPALSSSVPVLQGSEHGGGGVDTIVYGPASTMPQETIVDPVSGKTEKNTSAFILDDGNCNLLHNGSVVGSIDYVKGHCEFIHVPNGEFKVMAHTLSAHSGGAKYIASSYNTIQDLRARSINARKNSKIELLLLG